MQYFSIKPTINFPANFLFQSLSVFVELVKVLSHFCRNPDPDDMTSFDAAVLLGRLCVADNNAKKKLKDSLQQNHDTHIISKVNLLHLPHIELSQAANSWWGKAGGRGHHVLPSGIYLTET